MPIGTARRLLPANSIIGISCNTVQEAKDAVQSGADYIGIGAVFGTQTKALISPLVGVRGVGAILDVLHGTDVKAVAIGRINMHVLSISIELSFRRYQADQFAQNASRNYFGPWTSFGWGSSCFRDCSISRSPSVSPGTP